MCFCLIFVVLFSGHVRYFRFTCPGKSTVSFFDTRCVSIEKHNLCKELQNVQPFLEPITSPAVTSVTSSVIERITALGIS